MDRIYMILNDKEKAPMSLEQIITEEIREFKASSTYAVMLEGESYYRNRSDVQTKTNDIKNRSNTKIEHPLVKKLVDQKADYLLSKPFTIETANERYGEVLNKIFDSAFRKKIKSFAKGAVKSGIAYLQPFFKDGKLAFMRLPSTEVIPLWKDSERSELDAFIRFYDQTVYVGMKKQKITHAEFWYEGGVKRFRSDGTIGSAFVVNKDFGSEENDYTEAHFMVGNAPYNWESCPLLWMKYNDEELPLYYYLKELVDDINWQTSVTSDALRDIAKFIYILKNYGGQDLSEFIKDLKDYLAIKVNSDGGVDKLEADINVDGVMAYLEKHRRDVYNYASAVDTKDPDLGNASGIAIKFRYMDLDSDCDALGLELNAAFLRLKIFVDAYLQIIGAGDFSGDEFNIIFNKDLPVNEGDVIANAVSSANILSKRTIIENHPWVVDVDEELTRIGEEKKEALEEYGDGLFSDPTIRQDGPLGESDE